MNAYPLSIPKDPAAVEDYGVDWSDVLDSYGGDTIATSVWSVPSGITETTPPPSFTGPLTSIWLSGGTAGVDYDLVNTITTTGGRTNQRTLRIRVRDL